ncbi:galactokinase family protein [Emticicia sp. 21SJ11W-3]|uniref:GHMP family kinase ATP-binding protein n=1 Tax=Emticicia sp. 21SJ11W-3 TaxID=2916755 RepID=UPI0020A0610B|nr:galactokinase family protein [Emticicia sp. 21SJ11W-3]UTA69073.1 GHMP kinase [Emticicia sp. 21SJ11W-3]
MLTISTPGRICLFGEHQDYLGLPVIAAAISRRVQMTGQHRSDNKIIIHLPDIGSELQMEVSATRMPYQEKRDYFRSGYNVLIDKGLKFSKGIECTVNGNIPINSGTSSSSALLVTWIHFLSKMADNPNQFTSQELGELAYTAEIVEFNEPGGMMDQLSTSIGNAVYLQFEPKVVVRELKPDLGTFVLADSLEPKDTIGVLMRAKFARLDLVQKIRQTLPSFSLHDFNTSGQEDLKKLLTNDEYALLGGTLRNRDILREALALFESGAMSNEKLGQLLTEHHGILRDLLQISTPKIEAMMAAALAAGALGGKINGSGGGGCMFVYAPDEPEKVADAINAVGGRSYIIRIDRGTTAHIS